jgi:hypothetical protein
MKTRNYENVRLTPHITLFRSVVKTALHLNKKETEAFTLILKKLQAIKLRFGNLYYLRYMKGLHESLASYYSERSLASQNDISIGIAKDGFPKILLVRWAGLKKRDHRSMRLYHSIVATRYLTTVETSSSLESVWGRFESTLGPFKEGLLQLKLSGDIRPFNKEKFGAGPALPLTSRSSPNGPQAIAFGRDTKNLLDDQNRMRALQRVLELTLEGVPRNFLSDLCQPYHNYPPALTGQWEAAKMSVTFEPAKLKPRIFVAVGTRDQQVLGSLHDAVMSRLRSIPDDATYDRSLLGRRASEWWEQGYTVYYEGDWEFATDRLAREAYRYSLDTKVPGLGKAWAEATDYRIQISPELAACTTYSNTHIRFNQGQPLGMLSSWPCMAEVHHEIVWISAGSRAAAEGKYLILGDDFVTICPLLFASYRKLLGQLGVTVSAHTNSYYFEFAKRQFFRGVEVTGVRAKALASNRHDPLAFTYELCNLSERGYDTFDIADPAILKCLATTKKDEKMMRIVWGSPWIRSKDKTVEESVARWTVTLSGRSLCNLGNTTRNLENALKPFRQASAAVMSEELSTITHSSRDRFRRLSEDWLPWATRKLREVGGNSSPSTFDLSIMLGELTDTYTLSIRLLEKEWKLLTISGDVKAYLRPKVPEIFYTDLAKWQDKARIVRKFRVKRLRAVRRLLSVGAKG